MQSNECEAGEEERMSRRALPCLICFAPAHRDRPELRCLDATCSRCGWHFTSRHPAWRVHPERFTWRDRWRPSGWLHPRQELRHG